MKRITYFCLLLMLPVFLPSARAGTKEELMRLQSDVTTLRDQLREFEKTYSEKTEGLRSLIVQLNDQVAKSNMLLDKVSAALENQSSGARSNDEVLLQEIRALSGKIDDSATRISALAQQIEGLKVQSKPISQGIQGSPASGSSADALYSQAYQDLVQGNFDLAIQGFNAYTESNPTGTMAAAAQYNIGEAYFNQHKLPQAVAAFTRVINDFPGSDKTASALFKRGKAELAMKETDNAIADFRDLVQLYPTAPESDLAETELQRLGVDAAKSKRTVRETR